MTAVPHALVSEAPLAASGYWNASHADDTESIRLALAEGRHSVYLPGGAGHGPDGEYLVGGLAVPGSIEPSAQAGVVVPSGVHFYGDGPGATVLLNRADEDNNILVLPGISDSTVEGMTINGNWPAYANFGHGILGDVGNLTRVTLRDLEVKNCGSYGIGLETGTITDCTIENVWIDYTGADSLDIKNVNDNNSGLVITAVRSTRHSQRISGNAGVDVRGHATLSDIHVTQYPAGGTGIRFRGGDTTEPAGYGGHESSLTGFYCKPSSTTGTAGVTVNAHRVAVSNGTIEACDTGLILTPSGEVVQYRASITNVHCKGCITAGFRSVGDGNGFVNCSADNCNDNFRLEAKRGRVVGCSSVNGVTGVSIPAAGGATQNNAIVGTTFDNNTANVSNSGTGTRIVGCPGVTDV